MASYENGPSGRDLSSTPYDKHSANFVVTVHLRDVDNRDPIAERSIVLSSPDWAVKIGRGSSSGDETLRPAEDNAWFDSRVMSRAHAVLQANPDTKVCLLSDTV